MLIITEAVLYAWRKRELCARSLVCWNLTIFLPQLSRDCKTEVQRILHQRALDVKLDPDLQRRCMTDLGKWCSEKPDSGQVGHIFTSLFLLLVDS